MEGLGYHWVFKAFRMTSPHEAPADFLHKAEARTPEQIWRHLIIGAEARLSAFPTVSGSKDQVRGHKAEPQ